MESDTAARSRAQLSIRVQQPLRLFFPSVELQSFQASSTMLQLSLFACMRGGCTTCLRTATRAAHGVASTHPYRQKSSQDPNKSALGARTAAESQPPTSHLDGIVRTCSMFDLHGAWGLNLLLWNCVRSGTDYPLAMLQNSVLPLSSLS